MPSSNLPDHAWVVSDNLFSLSISSQHHIPDYLSYSSNLQAILQHWNKEIKPTKLDDIWVKRWSINNGQYFAKQIDLQEYALHKDL